mgnify:CR=1 FL=1
MRIGGKKKKKRPRMGEKQRNKSLRGELRLKREKIEKGFGGFEAEKQRGGGQG